jgi:hypothetical protein
VNDEEILAALRAERGRLTPVELAELLDRLTGGQLSDASMVTYFFRAFVGIPLKPLMDACRWKRLTGGPMTDQQLNALLDPWLGPTTAGQCRI